MLGRLRCHAHNRKANVSAARLCRVLLVSSRSPIIALARFPAIFSGILEHRPSRPQGVAAGRRDHRHFSVDQIGQQRGQSIIAALSLAIFDRDVLTFDNSRLLSSRVWGWRP